MSTPVDFPKQVVAYIQEEGKQEPFATFYSDQIVKFRERFYQDLYDEQGIQIPQKDWKKYPELATRRYKVIYPEDGESFRTAFEIYELHRFHSRTLKCIKT